MLKIKAMITDQRLLVAAFHAADLRHEGKESRGFISVCMCVHPGTQEGRYQSILETSSTVKEAQ